MIELLKEEMYIIRPFCLKKKEDVELWACAEGKMGRAWVNNKENPVCAMVIVADFCFLLGSMEKIDEELFIKLLSQQCRGKIIVTDSSHWYSIMEKNYTDKVKSFERYTIKRETDVFNKEKLNDFIMDIEPEFQLEAIDQDIYYKVLEDDLMADCCSNFSSVEEFLKHGIGYVIRQNGQIISAASSYSYCEGSIDITIGTQEEYRRKGLALACASKLILECLERKIYPRWDAANLDSVALAEKLGYHFEKEYVVYSICN